MTGLLAGCEPGTGLAVGPPTTEVDDGKADGASSGKTELKVTIAEADIRQARSRIGLVNAASETRRIWFYDTSALGLYEAGIILRAREIDGDDDDDATLKLRPFSIDDLTPYLRANDDVKCEIDRDVDSATPACSLKVDVDSDAIVAVSAGEHGPRSLFDAAQEEWLASVAPAGFDWESVVPLGPIAARVWEIRSDEVPEKLTAELWYMPDGGQVLELSMKVKDADADDALDELRDFVDDLDLDLAAEQESKTRRALESLTTTDAP